MLKVWREKSRNHYERIVHGVLLLLLVWMAGTAAFSMRTMAETVTLTGISNGSDITDALQDALDLGGNKKDPLTLIIPAGTYKCSDTIKLWSYTKVSMYNVTLKRSGKKKTGNFVRFGKKRLYPKKGYSGYSGYTDITIEGGTFDNNYYNGSVMQGAHAQNLLFKDVSFINVNTSHHVELAGVQNVVFDGCVFAGFKGTAKTKKSVRNYDALSFDILGEKSKKHMSAWPKNDETPCKNVTIKNCTFKNLQRGMGTHSGLQGCYHSGFNIVDNTFQNIIGFAVVTTNYSNCVISRNTIDNCGAGITFRTMDYAHSNYYMSTKGKKTKTNMNSRITDNVINITKTQFPRASYGIQLHGEKISSKLNSGKVNQINKGDYRMKGMTVSGNKITMRNKGNAIELEGVLSSTVKNNVITFVKSKAKGMTKKNGVVKQKQCKKVKTSGNAVKIVK